MDTNDLDMITHYSFMHRDNTISLRFLYIIYYIMLANACVSHENLQQSVYFLIFMEVIIREAVAWENDSCISKLLCVRTN